MLFRKMQQSVTGPLIQNQSEPEVKLYARDEEQDRL